MSDLLLFNSLTKKLEPFVPADSNKVRMYICGPTVYDSPHIGHARTYVSFDVMRRVLSEYFGYDVTLVMNITDIDDKIIKRAAERGITTDELSRKYENEFFEEMAKLNVLRPNFVTRVTEYVAETIKMVSELEKNGFTYVSNGSVYFDLKKYKESFKYNLLRPETLKEEQEDASADKKDKDDFVLWKSSKPGEPIYQSKWGPGRPGWHIECSAMSSAVFGTKLDIHAGGIDLAFPHHENEIAQCQGTFKETWVNYFLHTGHLNINGLKMSKSLKNFLTINEILEISTPENMRILFLQHSWNKDMNYDQEQLKHADSIRKKIFNFLSCAEAVIKRQDMRSLNDQDIKIMMEFESLKQEAHQAFLNNINTGKVLEKIIEIIAIANPIMESLHTDVTGLIYNYVFKILKIFGLILDKSVSSDNETKIAQLLCDFRSDVRKAAKSKVETKVFFEICDALRSRIKEYGYVIEDKVDESIIRKNQ